MACDLQYKIKALAGVNFIKSVNPVIMVEIAVIQVATQCFLVKNFAEDYKSHFENAKDSIK